MTELGAVKAPFPLTPGGSYWVVVVTDVVDVDEVGLVVVVVVDDGAGFTERPVPAQTVTVAPEVNAEGL